MSRRVAGALLAVMGSLALSPPPGVGQRPQPTFRGGVTLFEVAVTARDRDGRHVPGLQREDFLLRVDGRPVPIDTFVEVSGTTDRTGEGRFLLIVLDDIGSGPMSTSRVKRVAHALIDRMGPGDEAAVLGINGDAMTSTTDRDRLHEQVEAFAYGLEPKPMRAAEHAVSVVGELAAQLGAVERRRKVIVVVGSTALYDVSQPTGRDRSLEAWREAVQSAARHNVVVYVIDPQPVTSRAQMGEIGFARETGGLAIKTNLLDRAVDRVWSDLVNYYLLGYSVAPGAPERRASLKVRVTRDGVTTHARRTSG